MVEKALRCVQDATLKFEDLAEKTRHWDRCIRWRWTGKWRNTIIWVFPKIGVGLPNHPILIGFSIINHPFWGTFIFGNAHMIPSDTFQSLQEAMIMHDFEDWIPGNVGTLGVQRMLRCTKKCV